MTKMMVLVFVQDPPILFVKCKVMVTLETYRFLVCNIIIYVHQESNHTPSTKSILHKQVTFRSGNGVHYSGIKI